MAMSCIICLLLASLPTMSAFRSDGVSHSPLHSSYQEDTTLSIQSKYDIDWSDGIFSGEWISRIKDTEGTIHGTLNYGRTSYQGTFSAEVFSSDALLMGTINGIFVNHVLLGRLTSTNMSSESFVVGLISFTETLG